MRYFAPLGLALVLGSICQNSVANPSFTLHSPHISHGKAMSKQLEFKGFGCDGANQSPALQWSGVPKDTKSFALTVYDPDAPTGSGWWHWVVFNIPADSTGLPANIDATGKGLPDGAIQSITDFGQIGFGGACPPQGDKPHHYHFTLHALKVAKLELKPDTMPAMVGYMLNANTLGKATITGTYKRPK